MLLRRVYEGFRSEMRWKGSGLLVRYYTDDKRPSWRMPYDRLTRAGAPVEELPPDQRMPWEGPVRPHWIPDDPMFANENLRGLSYVELRRIVEVYKMVKAHVEGIEKGNPSLARNALLEEFDVRKLASEKDRVCQ